MADLEDDELQLALNGECCSTEVVIWLAREVKRRRDAQRASAKAARFREDVQGATIRALDRYLGVGVVVRNRIAETLATTYAALSACSREEFLVLAKAAIDRHLVGSSTLSKVFARIAVSIADDLAGVPVESAVPSEQLASHVVQLSSNAPLEIFPFVTSLHREVVLRHMDDESQDIEMSPEEADLVADRLRAAAATAREAKVP